MRSKNIKINKDKNLAELVSEHPSTVEVLLDYGLHCVGCIASAFDTIEAGSKVHGLSDKEIDEMVERLNEVVNFSE
jgi:hybrid cluster-associated redox disulfide protein